MIIRSKGIFSKNSVSVFKLYFVQTCNYIGFPDVFDCFIVANYEEINLIEIDM